MRPIEFHGQNTRLVAGPDDPEGTQPLPAYHDGTLWVSCWSLTWRERLRVFLTGRIWTGHATPYGPPPMWIDTETPEFPAPASDP